MSLYQDRADEEEDAKTLFEALALNKVLYFIIFFNSETNGSAHAHKSILESHGNAATYIYVFISSIH